MSLERLLAFKNSADINDIAKQPISIQQNNFVGRGGRTLPFEIVSLCDEPSWTVTPSGAMVDDMVHTRYGTMGKQVTALANSYVLLSLKKNMNAVNKLLVIDWYSDNPEYLSYLQILLQINGNWETHLITSIEPKVGREFRSGWNRIIINPLNFGVSGVTGEIAKSLDKITAIRLRYFARETEDLVVTIDRIGLIPNPMKEAIITFTFDDGNGSDYIIARPHMNKYNYVGVSYVIPTRIGTGNRMTLEQLKDLYDNGWDVCSHGWSHIYKYTTDEIIREEMIRPYEWLVGNGFTRSADHISFPGGVTNDDIEAVVKQIYKTARTTAGLERWALNTIPVINPYRLRTVGVTKLKSLEAMKDYVDKAIASKSWLVFMFHDIGDSPSNDGWTTANFQALIDYIAEKQVAVKTMSEMSDYMPDAISGRIERQTRYSDIEIADSTKGIVLTSPNGTKYRIKVGDDGTPTFTAV